MKVSKNKLTSGIVAIGTKDKQNAMHDSLAKLDEAYKNSVVKSSVPDTLGLTEKKLNTTTDEEIKKTVNDRSEEQKANDLQKIKTEYAEKQSELNDKKRSVKEESEQKTKNVTNEYALRRENEEDDALKKGTVSSSIYDNTKKATDESEATDVATAIKEGENKLGAIDFQIEVLNQKLANDLNAYEIAHAVKVQKEIDRLISERESENQKIIEYNNKIREQEAEYKQKSESEREKAKREEEETLRYEEQHGYTGAKKDNYLERYNIAREYYTSLPKESAIDALKRDTLTQRYLGYYYDKLLNELIFSK